MNVEHGLFRQQVIDNASGRLYGEVLATPRVSHLALTLLFAALGACIVYFATTVEWVSSVRIAGAFMADSTGNNSAIPAVLYVPASLRKKMLIDRTYYVSVDGLKNQAWTTVTIRSVSDQVVAHCPICSNPDHRAGPYVRVDAVALDPMVRLDNEWLSVGANVRFHFDLQLGKHTAWKLLSARLLQHGHTT